MTWHDDWLWYETVLLKEGGRWMVVYFLYNQWAEHKDGVVDFVPQPTLCSLRHWTQENIFIAFSNYKSILDIQAEFKRKYLEEPFIESKAFKLSQSFIEEFRYFYLRGFSLWDSYFSDIERNL